jgi:hypothetical protein
MVGGDRPVVNKRKRRQAASRDWARFALNVFAVLSLGSGIFAGIRQLMLGWPATAYVWPFYTAAWAVVAMIVNSKRRRY